jgi:hypothetical protein
LESTANIELLHWEVNRKQHRISARTFAATVLFCAAISALFASWAPLTLSIVTVFLFAGPHNWFELRYFLMRMPVRLGRSFAFFMTAFAGIGLLTMAYVSLPLLYYGGVWSGETWPTVIATWNTLMVVWVASLATLRARLRTNRDWNWIWAVSFALISLNWLRPEMFSLGMVYAHPLVALWFLDRHLSRTRPEWLKSYRRCLAVLPLLIGLIAWRLWETASLADDNGLAWRITQHAGGDILRGVSTHLLVSLHVFLEMLHYGVWLLALPLIGASGAFWKLNTVPIARHPQGFRRLVMMALTAGVFVVIVLWLGFSTNYAATRDIYFAVAIAHVLAEVPFLLRML